MAVNQTIGSISTAPQLGVDSKEVFVQKAETVWGELKLRVPELNTAFGQINATETNINNREASASASASAAANSALAAAASANFKGSWSSATAYTVGQSVLGTDNAFYVCLVGNTNQNPTSTSGYWKVNVPLGAIGNINSPLLDMPLKNSLAMKAGVGSATFTRASTATYIDRYGVLKTAAIDEPRFEKEGYLNEGASTNLMLYSEQFDNASWNKNAEITITPNTITSPNGETTADTITYTGTVSYKTLYGAITTSTLTSYTRSIFVKAGTLSTYSMATYYSSTSNGGRAVFDLVNKTYSIGTVGTILVASDVSATIKELTNGWFKCTITVNPASLGSITSVLAYDYPGLYSAQTNGYMYIFGAQLEALPFATSYIPTVASTVTRAADLLKVTFDNNATNYNDEYSILGDFNIPSYTTPTVYSRGLFGIENEQYRYVRIATIGTAIQGLTLPYNLSEQSPRICVTNGDGYSKAYENGVLKVTATTYVSTTVGTRSIIIGNQGHSNANTQLFGHIANFKVFDKCLTAQEVALC